MTLSWQSPATITSAPPRSLDDVVAAKAVERLAATGADEVVDPGPAEERLTAERATRQRLGLAVGGAS